MKKLLLLLVFATLSMSGIAQAVKVYGPEHNGYQLASDSVHRFYVANKFGIAISPLDSLTIHTEQIMTSISNSAIKDRLLIVRVLQQHVEPGRTQELLNMTTTYKEVAIFVLQDIEQTLRKKYTEEELEKLKQKQ